MITSQSNDVRKLRIDLEKAWEILSREFPFKNYIRSARKIGYFTMVEKTVQWSSRNAHVLDFGAGPCDKTALFAMIGMKVTAIDDLQDAWHKFKTNKEKIFSFAERMEISYQIPNENGEYQLPDKQFDVLMSHDVLEHLHTSPRYHLNKYLGRVKPGGLMVITVPNAANLRKRLSLLMGKSNYNRFQYYYWYPGTWRGHIREYVRNDLVLLNQYLGLELLELNTYHLQLDVLPPMTRHLFVFLSQLVPGYRDSWLLISRKPRNWTPKFKPNSEQFELAFGSQYYDYSNANFDWDE